ncbi:uncharacterized protein METZ01_LOCUS196800, partial [marine metagenome]
DRLIGQLMRFSEFLAKTPFVVSLSNHSSAEGSCDKLRAKG